MLALDSSCMMRRSISSISTEGIDLHAQAGGGFVDQSMACQGGTGSRDKRLEKRGRGKESGILDAHTVVHFIAFFNPRRIAMVSSTVGSLPGRVETCAPTRDLSQCILVFISASSRQSRAVRPAPAPA